MIRSKDLRLSLLNSFLALCLLSITGATHVDEIIPLPSATITPSESAIAISNQTFELNCTGVGTLRWYRGDDFSMPLDNHTLLLDDNATLLLMGNLYEEDFSQTDERGRTYFCTANNSLGVARSRSVQIPYFQGFGTFEGYGDVDNTTVTVRLGEAVALYCNVPQRPVPPIVWYMNDTLIEAVAAEKVVEEEPKYILLDGGLYLVIYNLVEADTTASYTCGVINVINPQNSSYNYTLNRVPAIPGGLLVYRPPITRLTVSTQNPTFYYIAATNPNSNDGTEVASSDNAITPTTQDEHLLRIRFQNNGNSMSGIRLLINEDNINVGGSFRTVAYTVVAPLNLIEYPLIVNASSFHRFQSEDITFNCVANGTNVKLRWYFNGLPLMNDNTTLTLTNVTVSDAGVYQCLWDGFFDSEMEMITWAFSVQVPIPPRNMMLSVTQGPPLDDYNRTLVSAGTTVTANISFVSDSLPIVTWVYYDANNNMTMDINFTNNTDYTAIGPVLADKDDSYQIFLTINNVTMNTAGFYYAIIDDTRTPPTQTPQWFVSQHIPFSRPEIDSSPLNCFLQSENSSITCTAQGFPEPTVKLRKHGSEVDSSDGTTHTDPFTGLRTFTYVISNSRTDAGLYTCEAGEGRPPLSRSLDIEFCKKPTIKSVPNVSGRAGQRVDINCTIESEPDDETDIYWYFGTTLITSGDKYTVVKEGTLNRVRISSLTAEDAGNYTCTANNTLIPAIANATISLSVDPTGEPRQDFPTLYVAIGIGGGVAILLIVIIIIIVCCVCCFVAKSKTGNYSTRQPHLTKDYSDGRGNVDRDSDEEDGGAEEPEAFQPQYESLPALRPSQPPQYKPSPAYNQGYGEDIEMKKVPLPDFDDYPPQFYRHDNGGGGGGMMGSSVPIGSQAGLQTRYEDFMSDDGQFV